MNKSKSIMNVEGAPQKKENRKEGNNKRNIIIASVIGAVVLIGLIVLVYCDYIYKSPCIYVDGESYNINDIEVRYNVYNAEAQIQMDALMGMYQGSYSDSLAYWNVDGVRDNAKDIAKKASIRYTVMYKEAVANGLSLTDEEKETVKKKATAFYDAMSSAHKKRAKFDLDDLIEYQEKITLANKYIDQIKAGYNVTNDTLETPIKAEDYDEIKFQVIVAPTTSGTSTTDEGVKLEDATLATRKAKMEEYLEKAKNGEELSELVADENRATYSYMETSLKRGVETYKTLLDALESLENGQLYSSVIDDGKAYYVVKLVDKNSTESFDSAVENAVAAKEEELFNADLNKLTEKYNVSEGSGWNDVNIGEVVLFPDESTEEFYAQPEESAAPETSATPDASTAPDNKEK